MLKGICVVSVGIILLLVTEAMAVISAVAIQEGDGIMTITPIVLSFCQLYFYCRFCILIYKKEETS